MRKNWGGGRREFVQGLGAVFLGASCQRTEEMPPGYQGILELEEQVLSFEASGRIRAVRVRRGDRVEAGAIIAELDDAGARLQRDARTNELEVARAELSLLEAGTRKEDVASAQAQVRAASATEALAAKNLARTKDLVASGVESLAQLDSAASAASRSSFERQSLEQRLAGLRAGARPEEIVRAKARVAAASANLALAEKVIADHRVLAPSPGVVLDVLVDPGELATMGTPAVTTADPARPYADVFVPEGEVARVHLGAKATVRVDGLGETVGGAVEHVAPRTEFTPRYLFSERERPKLVVRVRVRVDDPAEALHAGMPAFVEIEGT